MAGLSLSGCLKDNLDDGGPATGSWVLNEFLASNGGTSQDELGEADDWVELFTPTNQALPLDGLAQTDDPGDPDKFVIQGTDSLVPPGGYVLVWCDDETPPGPFHAPFKLSSNGETLQLRDSAGRLLDERAFGPQQQDVSEGRLPDGWGSWDVLAAPSPGLANLEDGNPAPARLVVNELLASNDACCTDENGEFDDWLELYNAGGESVQLAGLWLSDDANNPLKFQLLPDGDSLLAPGAFAVVWCDGQPAQGAFHASFALSGSGEDVVLTGADGSTVLDSQSYSAQQTDQSLGRVPDGGSTWLGLALPSPGEPNQP